MAGTERDLLLADINRLRLVLAAPASYRIRPGAFVDRSGLIALTEQIEQGWSTARDEADCRRVRLDLYGQIRRLGFDLPEPTLALRASEALTDSTRGFFGPDATLGFFATDKVFAQLRRAKRTLMAARDAWSEAQAPEQAGPFGDDFRKDPGPDRGDPPRASASGPLDAEQLRWLAEVVAPKQHRDLLIPNVALRVRLPQHASPLAQLYGDLIELNRIAGTPGETGDALAEWLAEAAYALGPLPERAEIDQLLVIVQQYGEGEPG